MQNVKKKSVLNLLFTLSYRIITIIFGILLPKLFITSYGSQVNGLHSSVNQVFSYVALLEAGIGAATLQSLFAPVAKEEYDKVNSYLSALSHYYNKVGVIYFFLLVIISGIYAFFVPVEGMNSISIFLYVIASGALNGINFFYLAKLKLLISAAGDEYITSTLSMVIYIVSSIAKIILIYIGLNVVIVQACFLFINIGFTFIYYLIAKRKYPWISFKEKPDFECAKQKNSVLVHKVSSLIFQNIDILLLTLFCDLNIVSIYAIYKMVINMITSIVATFSDSFTFIFGQKLNTADGDYSEYKKIIDAFNVFYSSIAFAFYTVTFLLILSFLKLYTSNMDINYIYPLLPWLYISIEVLTVGREAMGRTIEVAGHFKKTEKRAVCEAVINLGASIIAIVICKHFFGGIGGIYGALMGTIIAMMYRTIDINIYANKYILHRSAWKSFRIIGINILLFIGVVVLFKPLLPTINTYLTFFLHAIWITFVVLIIYVVVQIGLNMQDTKILFSLIKKRKDGGKK